MSSPSYEYSNRQSKFNSFLHLYRLTTGISYISMQNRDNASIIIKSSDEYALGIPMPLIITPFPL